MFFKIIGCCILIVLIFLIVLDLTTKYITSFAFANAALFCFSLYYFFSMLVNHEKTKLNSNPFFYVCCGIFIGSGIIVPTSLMIKYMYLLKTPKDLIYLVTGLSGVGNIIMNSFFIKALLCSKQSK
jgi:hypothetical protein